MILQDKTTGGKKILLKQKMNFM